MSLHPAHLTDSQDRLLPAALIPFCSYQGELLGKEVDGFVTCNQFQPTVLEGQICYSLNLSKVHKVNSSKTGKQNGLVLVLDPNTPGNEDENVARIDLGILSPLTDYTNGSYAMSALKKMTGTEGFLGLPDADKRCQTETSDEYNTQRFLEKVQAECHCTLWALDTKKEVGSPTSCITCPRISPTAPRPPHPALTPFLSPVVTAGSPALDSMLMSQMRHKKRQIKCLR